MKTKLLVVLMSGLFASSYAMADVVTGSLTGGALVQSITLGATTQIAVSSSNPTTSVSAEAPKTTQTATLSATGTPQVSVSTNEAPEVHVSGGVGSASVLTIQTASATSIVPVVTSGYLATIPTIGSDAVPFN